MTPENQDNFYSQELEISILGEMGLYFCELKDRIPEISASDFYFADTAKLFAEISRAYAKNPESDFTTLCSMLSKSSFELIAGAVGTANMSVNFNGELARLQELASNRRIKKAVQNLVIGANVIKPDDLIKIAETEQSGTMASTCKARSKQSLDEFITDIGKPSEKIKTGLSSIDKLLGGGLRIPSVSIIGAYPSVGKTALALNICARQSTTVILFSLEMSTGMIYERLISDLAQINYGGIIGQTLTPDEIEDMRVAGKKLKNKPFYVFDNVYDVEGQAGIIGQVKPKLVVVDYIQKVKTHKRIDSRRNEIDYISGAYKQIAKTHNCHILLLSQLARSGKEKPTMASLKESGALEADGDYVFLLNRPYVHDKGSNKFSPEQTEILIDKNKYGNVGRKSLYFEGRYQRFKEDKNDNVSRGDIYNEPLPF
jgi:replicative DNA helicase